MINIKKLHSAVSNLFIRARKLNIFLVFIPKSWLSVTKKLNTKHYTHFLQKIQQLHIHKDKQETDKSFRKLPLILHLILTLMTLRGSTEYIPENHIHFWPLLLLFKQIMLYVFKRMYQKKYREKSRQLKKKLAMKNCNMTLIEQQQRYLYYHQVR